MRYRKFAVVTAAVWILALLTIAQIQAQDTQWRGANRDGKYPDSGLLKSWPVTMVVGSFLMASRAPWRRLTRWVIC